LLLHACERGRPYVVKSIAARNAALLSDIGLFAGRCFTVVNRFPFRGPLVVDLGGYLVAIARSAAAGVEVAPEEDRVHVPSQ